MTPAEIATEFYQAFQDKDAERMAKCYADDVHFSDPVFPQLKGESARNMWRMLCGRSKDLRIEFQLLRSNETSATVHWDAYYTFAQTGRSMVNRIDATLGVSGDKIVRHSDVFSFWRWSSQALGLPGRLLGWTPLLQRKVQRTAAASLASFEASRPTR